MKSKNIARASMQDIDRMKSDGRLLRTDASKAGEDLGRDFWAKAVIVKPKAARSVHLKVDADVFDFFKKQGKGHLTRMQDVLRAYVNAHRQS